MALQRVVGLRANGVPSLEQWGVVINATAVTFQSPDDAVASIDWKHPVSGVQAFLPNAMTAWCDVWAYLIIKPASGATPAQISGVISSNAPNIGPPLPAGYTHYAMAFSIRCDANGALNKGLNAVGNRVFFETFPYQTVYNWVAPNTASNQINVQYWNWVPDDALSVNIWWDGEVAAGPTAGQGNIALALYGRAPVQFYTIPQDIETQQVFVEHPTNAGMAISLSFYDAAGYARYSAIFLGFQIESYTVANGG